jgi:hypothetical protein
LLSLISDAFDIGTWAILMAPKFSNLPRNAAEVGECLCFSGKWDLLAFKSRRTCLGIEPPEKRELKSKANEILAKFGLNVSNLFWNTSQNCRKYFIQLVVCPCPLYASKTISNYSRLKQKCATLKIHALHRRHIPLVDREVLLSRFLIELVSEPPITLTGKLPRELKAERTR